MLALALLLAVAGLILGGIAGYFLGKYFERSRWNDLIDDGIIPRPRKG